MFSLIARLSLNLLDFLLHCHCERPKGVKQSPVNIEIASLTLLRTAPIVISLQRDLFNVQKQANQSTVVTVYNKNSSSRRSRASGNDMSANAVLPVIKVQ